jgi:antitoxin ChpS
MTIMVLTKLRQQGGAVVLTIPSDIASIMGWRVGTQVAVEVEGAKVSLTPTHRIPRGRKNVQELLNEIDSDEISFLNETVANLTVIPPTGKEFW